MNENTYKKKELIRRLVCNGYTLDIRTGLEIYHTFISGGEMRVWLQVSGTVLIAMRMGDGPWHGICCMHIDEVELPKEEQRCLKTGKKRVVNGRKR